MAIREKKQFSRGKQNALRRANISPSQRQVLNQIQARQQYNSQNMESKIIPDTRGDVYLDKIMKEIIDASNAVA